MPDKWDQYAVQPQNNGGADRWSQYATPVPATEHGNLDVIPSSESEPGFIGGAKTAVHNFGARVANNGLSILRPLLHPEDTAHDILNRGGFPLTPESIKSSSYDPSGVDSGNTATNIIGDMATAGILHKAGAVVPKIGTALRSGAAKIDNAAIGTTADAYEHGADPGRALATNRVIGTNAATLSPKLTSLIPDAVAEHRAIVASNPSNAVINTGPLVTEPFDSQISDKTNPRTGVAAPTQVSKAGLTRRLLTNVPDEVSGRSTPMMRDPNLTPLEATNLKSNIYDMTDYDNPSQSALSNKGLKGAARNLKVAVEQAVPESIPSGQRLHDLMAAKDILEPQSKYVKLPTSKSGIIDRAVTGGMTGGAAGLDIVGSGLQDSDLARYLKPFPFVGNKK